MREMTTPLFRARLAQGAGDILRAQSLRTLAFRRPAGSLDADQFDSGLRHVMIETREGALVATFRTAVFDAGDDLSKSYAAQHYDLSIFGAQPGRKAEVGRLCLHPKADHPDILRLCWAMLAQLVVGQGLGHLFGCTSFSGSDPAGHSGAFAHLADHALGPPHLRPSARSANRIPLAGLQADPKGIPNLLRFYLGLGGWVADHAIIDTDLDTVHVFTALDLSALSPSKASVLVSMAERFKEDEFLRPR